MVEFSVGDTKAQGYLATPANGSGPGVIVLHAWWGLNDIFTGVCDRLAQEGFTAFAPDLYGGRIGTTVEEAKALLNSLDWEQSPQLVLAAAQYLRNHPAATGPAIGAVGFSMGAMWASLLATELQPQDTKAVVLFYGVASDLDAAAYGQSRAAFQVHLAPNDPWATDEEVEQAERAIRGAGRDLSLYRYDGTLHWFFEPDRPEYDAVAAELAWERMLAFLKEQLTT